MSHVVFLPKTSSPAFPKDLRPIVLSSIVSKVFTRLLLQRLRPRFPAMTSGQIIGETGAQTLHAAFAVQHAIRLSEERKQLLVVGQLDIAEAFDTVTHEAVASFLAAAGPSRRPLAPPLGYRSECDFATCGSLLGPATPQGHRPGCPVFR